MDEFFQLLNSAGVRYVLIGGQAMRLFGMPRYSMDWDIFIPPRDTANLDRINSVLEGDIDMPLEPMGPTGQNFLQTYQTQWGVVQFHLGVPGLPRFDEVEAAATLRKTEKGTPVKCLSGPHLLTAKKAANRPSDQADIDYLTELERLGKL